VVVLDLRVVGSFPVDEHANADVEVVGFSSRDNAFGNRILNGLCNAVLSRSEHLNGLTGVLDGDLVVKDRVRLAGEVRCDDGEKRREAVLVVRQRVAECRFSGRATRAHEKVDVRDLVAITDERLAEKYFVDLGHIRGFSQAINTTSTNATPPRPSAPVLAQFRKAIRCYLRPVTL